MDSLIVFQDSYLVREQATWLPESLEACGLKTQVIATKDLTLGRELGPFPVECAVVFVGSIAFCRQMTANHAVIPGAYYSDTRYRCSHYLPDLPIDNLLNPRPVFVPAGLLTRSVDHYFDLIGADQIFMRPDSGAKVFSGLVVRRKGFEQEIGALEQLTGITPQTMVMLSPVRSIESEYRFVIVRGEVVAGSRYMMNGEISLSGEIDDRCLRLASEIARLPRQVDLAYTCDICISQDQARIVELNAFSTSGLYACDRNAAFQAVAKAAVLEHQGQISLE